MAHGRLLCCILHQQLFATLSVWVPQRYYRMIMMPRCRDARQSSWREKSRLGSFFLRRLSEELLCGGVFGIASVPETCYQAPNLTLLSATRPFLSACEKEGQDFIVAAMLKDSKV
ncbi:hypothetical protein BDU57DRAFT_521615 [Ampelomyces quisqualis]|uniref:Uncharacterized protein n=1 Tax=Ampelomyces quisqualis TaxID=50730 RepID=A0A6A5QEQ6_AMPQU|nr:hypothetical protein BDU57DRAFT_521615 [Ampelomyces quisqualis]